MWFVPIVFSFPPCGLHGCVEVAVCVVCVDLSSSCVNPPVPFVHNLRTVVVCRVRRSNGTSHLTTLPSQRARGGRHWHTIHAQHSEGSTQRQKGKTKNKRNKETKGTNNTYANKDNNIRFIMFGLLCVRYFSFFESFFSLLQRHKGLSHFTPAPHSPCVLA